MSTRWKPRLTSCTFIALMNRRSRKEWKRYVTVSGEIQRVRYVTCIVRKRKIWSTLYRKMTVAVTIRRVIRIWIWIFNTTEEQLIGRNASNRFWVKYTDLYKNYTCYICYIRTCINLCNINLSRYNDSIVKVVNIFYISTWCAHVINITYYVYVW